MLKFLIPFFCGVFIILTFFFSICRVEGSSMSPLIENGSLILVRKVPDRFFRAEEGDILVFRNPENGRPNVKRCTAVDSGGIFLVGINLAGSTDSRHYGRVSPDRILGKVLFY